MAVKEKPAGKKGLRLGKFDSRYGISVRKKYAEIEKIQRKKQECICCGKKTAKRIAYGIFECKSCGKKFAAKAYSAK